MVNSILGLHDFVLLAKLRRISMGFGLGVLDGTGEARGERANGLGLKAEPLLIPLRTSTPGLRLAPVGDSTGLWIIC